MRAILSPASFTPRHYSKRKSVGMKKILVSIILWGVVLSIVCSGAAAPPKFAGTWILNRNKSEGLTGGLADAEVRLVVTQDERLLSYEQQVLIRGRQQPAQELTYRMDGEETTAEVVRPVAGTMYLKAKWLEATKSLELVSTIAGESSGKEVKITTQEQWQLLENGKALRVTRTRTSPQGRQVSRLYFDKD